MTVPVLDYAPEPEPYHEVEALTRGPNWLMWVAIVGCAVFWAGALVWWAA